MGSVGRASLVVNRCEPGLPYKMPRINTCKQGRMMLESIALLAIWAGLGIALYGFGLPIEWVFLLLAAALLVDLFLLRRKRRAPRALPKAEQPAAIGQRPARENSMNDASEDPPDPPWRKFSITRIPANRGHNDGAMHAVLGDVKDEQLTAPCQPSPRTEVGHANTQPEAAKTAPTTPIRAESPQADPLAIYRPEQFDAPPRAASIAASPPPVPVSRSTEPTGPAYEPPAPRSASVLAARTPNAPRPPRPVLKPSDFQRNAGKRGFLYLARNPEHWDGLFKVGQTLRHPRFRVQELNALHAKHKDIGTFELLDVVEVADAYGAEQVLFLVLSALRPVPGREFFIADKAYLSKVMRAVADFITGRPEELNNLYRDLDPNDFPAWPGKAPWYRRPYASGARGWVYLARCQYHLADTYLFGATRETPEAEVAKLNDGQSSDTPQIGFYAVVFALPVWDTKASRIAGWRALAQWKLYGSRSYVRGPFAQIVDTLTQALRRAG